MNGLYFGTFLLKPGRASVPEVWAFVGDALL